MRVKKIRKAKDTEYVVKLKFDALI